MLKTPPMIVPTPSARRPLVSVASSNGRSVMSASARNMPVDSIMTTIITRHIVAMATMSKVGRPKWNG